MCFRLRPGAFLLVLAWGCTSGCHGRERVVAVEREDGAITDGGLGTFGPIQPLGGLLDATASLQDPTLTADELELYFAANMAGGDLDIWRSTRAAVDQPWAPATRVDELSSTGRDVEPDLSGDGLTIYLARDLGPLFQILVSQRTSRTAPWSAPQLVTLSDPPQTDHGPTLDRQGLTMVFAIESVTTAYDLYQTRRIAQGASWETTVPLAEVNTKWEDWDAGLFMDGLALAFASRRLGDHLTADLFETRRASLDQPFGLVTPMVELNSPYSEGDPWLSNNGRHVVFSVERDGISRLFEAWR